MEPRALAMCITDLHPASWRWSFEHNQGLHSAVSADSRTYSSLRWSTSRPDRYNRKSRLKRETIHSCGCATTDRPTSRRPSRYFGSRYRIEHPICRNQFPTTLSVARKNSLTILSMLSTSAGVPTSPSRPCAKRFRCSTMWSIMLVHAE